MNGIADIITLLLGLSGFGMQANPKAPTPDASLQYAIPDADLVVHFDAASVVPNNYKRLVELADQPQIKASPDLSKMMRSAVTEVESTRGLVKTMTGIDLATDVSDATAFVQAPARGAHEPNALVAVHGKFSVTTIDKISALVHKPAIKLKDGGAWLEVDDQNAVAVTRDGVLLFGGRGLLSERTRPDWKSPAHAAGSSLGYAADMLAAKPVFGVSVTLSQSAREQALAGIGGDNFATDMIKRGKTFSFAVFRDGIGWTWVDSTKAGLDAMTEISNGMVEILRAAQIAPRGFAKIVFGALESYRKDPKVDELLRHKADLVKIVDSYLGDGSFKAKVDADAKALKLSVRLTGKTASDVVPFGVLVPMGVAGFFLVGRDAPSQAPAVLAAPPPMTSKPGNKQPPRPAPAPHK